MSRARLKPADRQSPGVLAVKSDTPDTVCRARSPPHPGAGRQRTRDRRGRRCGGGRVSSTFAAAQHGSEYASNRSLGGAQDFEPPVHVVDHERQVSGAHESPSRVLGDAAPLRGSVRRYARHMQSFFALSSRISLKPIVRSPVTTRNATGAFPQPVTGSTALIAQPPTKTLTTSQTAVGVAAVARLCLRLPIHSPPSLGSRS